MIDKGRNEIFIKGKSDYNNYAASGCRRKQFQQYFSVDRKGDSMKKYDQIVFDIDGTLIDTEYAVLHSLQDTVKELCKKEIPVSKLTFALGITGADALKILKIKDVPYALELWDKNMKKYEDTVKIFEGITGLLEELMKSDCEMGIVTSKRREEYDTDFGRFDISCCFKTIVCADDTKEHKPEADPLLKYVELSGGDREKTLYIGDSRYDSECAENAGIDFALAVWGSHSKSVKAEYYLEKPSDLSEIITV